MPPRRCASVGYSQASDAHGLPSTTPCLCGATTKGVGCGGLGALTTVDNSLFVWPCDNIYQAGDACSQLPTVVKYPSSTVLGNMQCVHWGFPSHDFTTFAALLSHSGDVPIEYCGEQQAVCAVGIVRPRHGVFLEAVRHVIVLCTTSEVSGGPPSCSAHHQMYDMSDCQVRLLGHARTC